MAQPSRNQFGALVSHRILSFCRRRGPRHRCRRRGHCRRCCCHCCGRHCRYRCCCCRRCCCPYYQHHRHCQNRPLPSHWHRLNCQRSNFQCRSLNFPSRFPVRWWWLRSPIERATHQRPQSEGQEWVEAEQIQHMSQTGRCICPAAWQPRAPAP
jgi:hypothetical protein